MGDINISSKINRIFDQELAEHTDSGTIGSTINKLEINVDQKLSDTEANIRGGSDTLDTLSDQLDGIDTKIGSPAVGGNLADTIGTPVHGSITADIAAIEEWGTPVKGSVSPLNNTEITIMESNGVGDYAASFRLFLEIDLSAMSASDKVEIRVYKKVDESNYKLLDLDKFSGVQIPDLYSISGLWGDNLMAVKVTLKQTAGPYDNTYNFRHNVLK